MTIWVRRLFSHAMALLLCLFIAACGGGGGGDDVENNGTNSDLSTSQFTKLDGYGDPLDASAASWECVRDNVTGLVWENKTNDGTLRDGTTLFGGLACTTAECSVDNYLAQVQGLCGYDDWRLPSAEELVSIRDTDWTSPAIDPDYFPNTASSPPYVSSTTCLFNEEPRTQFVGFENAGYTYCADPLTADPLVSNGYYVRAVRGAQP